MDESMKVPAKVPPWKGSNKQEKPLVEPLAVIPNSTPIIDFHKRASLLRNHLGAAGTIIEDPASLFETTIRIDDAFTDQRGDRPVAFVVTKQGPDAQVEIVDILESVRNDASSVGHPVIA